MGTKYIHTSEHEGIVRAYISDTPKLLPATEVTFLYWHDDLTLDEFDKDDAFLEQQPGDEARIKACRELVASLVW
jgi:hypothetical protein